MLRSRDSLGSRPDDGLVPVLALIIRSVYTNRVMYCNIAHDRVNRKVGEERGFSSRACRGPVVV